MFIDDYKMSMQQYIWWAKMMNVNLLQLRIQTDNGVIHCRDLNKMLTQSGPSSPFPTGTALETIGARKYDVHA